MQVKILKFWHQWSWVFHISWAAVITIVYITNYANSEAANTKDITEIKKQHTEENMAVRMAIQENTTQEINSRLASIEAVQSKIFDRINTLADRDRK